MDKTQEAQKKEFNLLRIKTTAINNDEESREPSINIEVSLSDYFVDVIKGFILKNETKQQEYHYRIQRIDDKDFYTRYKILSYAARELCFFNESWVFFALHTLEHKRVCFITESPQNRENLIKNIEQFAQKAIKVSQINKTVEINAICHKVVES